MRQKIPRKNGERSGIIILLSILLCISVAIGYLEGREKKSSEDNSSLILPEPELIPYKPFDTKQKPEDLAHLPLTEILDYLYPLIISGSVEKIAQVLDEISADKAQEVVEFIASLEGGFNRQEKIELLLNLALHYKNNKKEVGKIFSVISKNKELVEGFADKRPFVYIAATTGYEEAIRLLFDWLDTVYYKGKPKEIDKVILRGIRYSIDNDDVVAFKTIVAKNKYITKDLGAKILWEIINRNGKAELLLALRNYNIDYNHSPDGKITPLIKATQQNNYDLVKTLLNLGAERDLFVDPEVGTPLQNALEKGNVEIELLLREFGAQEKMELK